MLLVSTLLEILAPYAVRPPVEYVGRVVSTLLEILDECGARGLQRCGVSVFQPFLRF